VCRREDLHKADAVDSGKDGDHCLLALGSGDGRESPVGGFFNELQCDRYHSQSLQLIASGLHRIDKILHQELFYVVGRGAVLCRSPTREMKFDRNAFFNNL
jgi:hypothetical protein